MISKSKTSMVTLLTAFLIVILVLLPNPFSRIVFPNTERVPVEIMSVNNNQIQTIGLLNQGEQICDVKILKGQFKGQIATGVNMLTGRLETDKIFEIGDTSLAVIDFKGNEIRYVNLVDHYRLDLEIYLSLAFVLMLIVFAGGIGLRSILSFFLTILMIWKILIPAFLKGFPPILVALLMVMFLTIIIITLVFGIDKKSLAAIMGSLLGTLLTSILSILLVDQFQIHGAVMAQSESLLYAGFGHLNLTHIFIASIFISCSGAMMDVAVDITSAVEEVVIKGHEITKKEAIKSGMTVGRAVMGTMTTTLLLAYSGGFISLLMVFMAQGTPLINILNLKFIAGEILHTLIGSIGLVTVAPFTALTSGLLLGKDLQNL